MGSLIRFVTGHPLWTLFGVALLTALALAQLVRFEDGKLAAGLEIDPAVSRLVPENSPERKFYDRVRRIFGSDETLVVALVADDVFTPDVLGSVKRLTERLERVDGVHHVVSLSSALNIRAADGDLEIEPFLVDVPEDAESLAAMRREALENPIYAGNLVARSGGTTALFVYLLDMTEREYIRRGIDEEIRAIADEEKGDAEVWITGSPTIKAATSRILLADLRFVVPAAFGIAALIALLSFRTARGVLVPIGTILIALIWTLGSMAAADRPLNLVTTILPPLLLTIGFAYAVHIVSDYYDVLRRSEPGELPDRRDVVKHTLEEVSVPVLLTGLTTGVGFSALLVSPIGAIREFGLFATIGVFATMISALSFAPAVLALLPVPRKLLEAPKEGWIDRAAEQFARFDLRRRTLVLGMGGLVALISVWGASRIDVSNDLVGNFEPDEPARVHFEQINRHLEGSNPFYIVLETDYRDAFTDPNNLAEVQKLQRWLEAQEGVGGTTSLVDYLVLIHRGFHDGDPEQQVIPRTQALAKQLLFFGANDEIENFVDSRYQTAAVLVRAKVIDSGELAILADRIDRRLAELPERIHGTVTGSSVMVARAIDEISSGQVRSLGIAFAAIYVILALLFTSFRVGLVALLPNALPVLIYYGAMGLTGVTLNATTSLAGCIVLGIAVDDTIHLMSRFNAEARRSGDETAGIIAALRGVARPVTYTTIGLVLGFMTLTFTDLRNQVHFGALGAFTLFMAWVVDVTFTPALCSGVRIVGLWDLLALDLGPDPQRSIPLFDGLSRHRARVVALMTEMVQFQKGDRIFTTGEHGEDMYVVIDGELEVSIKTESGAPRILNVLGRGATVGEVGLFYGRRTADVVAGSDTRLLRLTEENLARLRRRYPRVGAQIFANLSRILADTVARTTERLQ